MREEHRTELEQARAEIAELRRRDEEREGELTGLREVLAQMESERAEWDAALQRVQESLEVIDDLREKLAMAERERDALAENARDSDALRTRVETLSTELDELKRAREESLVEACDLRVQVNRLENDVEEERDHRRRKVYDQQRGSGDRRLQLVQGGAQADRLASDERQGKTPNGRRYITLANQDLARDDLKSARQNLQMASTFEPDNAWVKQTLAELKEKLR